MGCYSSLWGFRLERKTWHCIRLYLSFPTSVSEAKLLGYSHNDPELWAQGHVHLSLALREQDQAHKDASGKAKAVSPDSTSLIRSVVHGIALLDAVSPGSVTYVGDRTTGRLSDRAEP